MSTDKEFYNSNGSRLNKDCPPEHPVLAEVAAELDGSPANTGGEIIDTHNMPEKAEDWDGTRNNDITVLSRRMVSLELKVGEKGWNPDSDEYEHVSKSSTVPEYKSDLEPSSLYVNKNNLETSNTTDATEIPIKDNAIINEGQSHADSLIRLDRSLQALTKRAGLPDISPDNFDSGPNFKGTFKEGEAVSAAPSDYSDLTTAFGADGDDTPEISDRPTIAATDTVDAINPDMTSSFDNPAKNIVPAKLYKDPEEDSGETFPRYYSTVDAITEAIAKLEYQMSTEINLLKRALDRETELRLLDVNQEETNRLKDVDKEELARVVADKSIQTEIDSLEASTGMKTDGTFSAYTGTILSDAKSMKEADIALETSVGALESKLDNAVAQASASASSSGGGGPAGLIEHGRQRLYKEYTASHGHATVFTSPNLAKTEYGAQVNAAYTGTSGQGKAAATVSVNVSFRRLPGETSWTPLMGYPQGSPVLGATLNMQMPGGTGYSNYANGRYNGGVSVPFPVAVHERDDNTIELYQPYYLYLPSDDPRADKPLASQPLSAGNSQYTGEAIVYEPTAEPVVVAHLPIPKDEDDDDKVLTATGGVYALKTPEALPTQSAGKAESFTVLAKQDDPARTKEKSVTFATSGYSYIMIYFANSLGSTLAEFPSYGYQVIDIITDDISIPVEYTDFVTVSSLDKDGITFSATTLEGEIAEAEVKIVKVDSLVQYVAEE
jgi:hypothetical protein